LAHKLLAESCIQYTLHFLTLSDQKHDLPTLQSGQLEDFLEKFYQWPPLLNYSRFEWPRHEEECVLDPKYNSLIYTSLVSPSWKQLWKKVPEDDHFVNRLPGMAPLPIAILLNLFDVCAMMLADGADPNQIVPPLGYYEYLGSHARRLEGEGDSCLTLCIINGNENMARLLIDAGSNIDHRSDTQHIYEGVWEADGTYTARGESPLQKAVLMGRIDLVQILMESGASSGPYSFEPPWSNGHIEETRCPLEMTAMMEKWDIFQLIRDKGSDVYLDLVLRLSRDDLIWETKRGAPVKERLIVAAKEGDIGVVNKLHETYHIEVGTLNDMLYEAASYSTADMVKVLLELGANVNGPSFSSYPLRVAVREGNQQFVKMLLDAGAYILDEKERKSDGGLLCHAGRHLQDNGTSIIRLLLEHGDDPNAGRGRCGWIGSGSPLQEATLLDGKN
jgi:ankyrin repeat protein